MLGMHPGPDIGVAAAAALAGHGRADVYPTLRALARAHLVREVAPGRFGFHDLLRTYAAELAQTDTPATELPEVSIAKVSKGSTFEFEPRRSLPLTVV